MNEKPSEKTITARRHELFEVFTDEALKAVSDNPAVACKLADTALKAISGAEHESDPSTAPADAASLAHFEEDLKRAYGSEPKTEPQNPNETPESL